MENIKDSRAYAYCKWALLKNNNKVPRYVKLQCAAWKKIADGKDKEAVIDEKMYNKIIRVLDLMVHPDLQKPMSEALTNHAMLLITAIFCTRLKSDTSIRYYITALLEIARKNFKTFDSAVIFILLMLTEPKFSRYFSVAPDLKLSKELQLAIQKIIKSSPELYDDKDPLFKTLRNEVRCLITDSTYTPLAYSNDRMDGKQANAFLADEAGAMDSYPVEAMRSSQTVLRNKLGVIISTQYPNDNNVFVDEIDKAKKTLDGLRDSKRMFALLFEPNTELVEEWQENDLVIYQSNPVAIELPYVFEAIKEMRSDAILYENKRENYLCKHNNIKYKSLGVEGYVDILAVKRCVVEKPDIDFWRGRRVFIGLDLSMSDDNVSVAMLTYDGTSVDDAVIYSKTMGFIPKGRLEWKIKREGVDYRRLIREGNCIACGDEVIDYTVVEDYVLSLKDKYGVSITQLGYDKWNALSSVQKFENADIECVEILQHSRILHSPTKLLKEKILKGQFKYENNLMLEINFQNARCTYDTNNNMYVSKKKSIGKVDQVVSNFNAMYLIEQELLNNGSFVVQVL